MEGSELGGNDEISSWLRAKLCGMGFFVPRSRCAREGQLRVCGSFAVSTSGGSGSGGDGEDAWNDGE